MVANSLKAFLAYLKETEVQFVDFRFTDLKGTWHHITFPVSAVDEDLLKGGIYFDGSSIPGWCPVNHSDTLLVPDLGENLKNIIVDPFSSMPTIIVTCDVYDPITNQPYSKDPRAVGKKAEAYLNKTGFADKAFFGPEAEFFIFDAIRFGVDGHQSFYEIASDEFLLSNAKLLDDGNHGYRPQKKGGYFPVAPLDSLQEIRAEMLMTMAQMGIEVEKHHHEVAAAQHEIGIRFNTLIKCADTMQVYKYVVRNVAHSYGKTASFMPKPIYGDNGSGMHVHQSLWQGNSPLFAGEGYAGLSDIALYYIGGILKHAKSLNAFTNPTTNSYKRLVPGFEAPVICAYSSQNRSAACRIPLGVSSKSCRVEVRFPDPTANSYLAFSAMLMAGLDGIRNKIHPGDAKVQDLFEEKEVARKLPTVSGSLRESLSALESDHDYLLEGDVFTKDLIQSYCALKWDEVYALEHHPHPIEFANSYNF